jgi:hypothetical protein
MAGALRTVPDAVQSPFGQINILDVPDASFSSLALSFEGV